MKASQGLSRFLLAAILAAAGLPAFAKNGADDPAGDDRGRGKSAEPGDDKGGLRPPTSPGDATLATAGSQTVAVQGTYDPPGDDRGRGRGLEPGDDHGTHIVAGQAGARARVTKNAAIADRPKDGSKAKGRIQYRLRNKGGKEEFSIQLKVRYPDPALQLTSAGAARNAGVYVTFRDAAGTATAECRFDFDEIDRRVAEYRVKLIRQNQSLREKEGSCDVNLSNSVADPGIPVPQKGSAEIYVTVAGNKVSVASLNY